MVLTGQARAHLGLASGGVGLPGVPWCRWGGLCTVEVNCPFSLIEICNYKSINQDYDFDLSEFAQTVLVWQIRSESRNCSSRKWLGGPNRGWFDS